MGAVGVMVEVWRVWTRIGDQTLKRSTARLTSVPTSVFCFIENNLICFSNHGKCISLLAHTSLVVGITPGIHMPEVRDSHAQIRRRRYGHLHGTDGVGVEGSDLIGSKGRGFNFNLIGR